MGRPGAVRGGQENRHRKHTRTALGFCLFCVLHYFSDSLELFHWETYHLQKLTIHLLLSLTTGKKYWKTKGKKQLNCCKIQIYQHHKLLQQRGKHEKQYCYKIIHMHILHKYIYRKNNGMATQWLNNLSPSKTLPKTDKCTNLLRQGQFRPCFYKVTLVSSTSSRLQGHTKDKCPALTKQYDIQMTKMYTNMFLLFV